MLDVEHYPDVEGEQTGTVVVAYDTLGACLFVFGLLTAYAGAMLFFTVPLMLKARTELMAADNLQDIEAIKRSARQLKTYRSTIRQQGAPLYDTKRLRAGDVE